MEPKYERVRIIYRNYHDGDIRGGWGLYAEPDCSEFTDFTGNMGTHLNRRYDIRILYWAQCPYVPENSPNLAQ